MVQTAEGALNEVHDMLQRLNELAVKSANGTNQSEDRSYIQKEVEQLQAEITRTSNDTTFNKFKLLSSDKTMVLQVGTESGHEIEVNLKGMSATSIGVGATDVKMGTASAAKTSIAAIEKAIKSVSELRADLGAVQNRLEHTVNNLDNVVENTTSAEAEIRDTDIADEMVKYANNNILQQAGTSMLAQANQSNQLALSLLG